MKEVEVESGGWRWSEGGGGGVKEVEVESGG